MGDSKTKKACRAVNCSMRDTAVTTDRTTCLACGAELKPDWLPRSRISSETSGCD